MEETYLRHAVEAALCQTILEHPALQAGILDEDSRRPAFVALKSIDLQQHVEWRTVEPSTEDRKVLRETLVSQVDTRWAAQRTRPSWRVVVLQSQQFKSLEIIFVWHHPVSDGIGAKIFHESLHRHLNSPPTPTQQPKLTDHVLTLPEPNTAFPASQDSMCKHAISLSFALSTLWRELKPTILDFGSTTRATWAPILTAPYGTRLRNFTVDSATLQKILAACRNHGTTLTGLLHAITLVSLASQLSEDEAPGFMGQTAVDMRPLIRSVSSKSRESDPRRTIANIFTVMDHEFSPAVVKKMRNQNTQKEYESLIWSTATKVREEIQQSLDLCTKDKWVGLMKFILDWRILARFNAKGTRPRSWLVTNLGVLDESSASGTWQTEGASFALSAEVIGAAIHVCTVTVKEKELSVCLTWQEGVIDDERGKRLCKDMQEWLVYLGCVQS